MCRSSRQGDQVEVIRVGVFMFAEVVPPPLLLPTSSCRFYTDMCWLEQTHAEALWWKFQRWTQSWSNGRVFEMTLFNEAVSWDVRLSSGWWGHWSAYWKRGSWSPSETSKSILLSVQCKQCTKHFSRRTSKTGARNSHQSNNLNKSMSDINTITLFIFLCFCICFYFFLKV